MAGGPESRFTNRLRECSGLDNDRVEPASFGATLGFPDMIFYDNGPIFIEGKVGTIDVNGYVRVEVRASQRLWFQRAKARGIVAGLAIGLKDSMSFMLATAEQVEHLYLTRLKAMHLPEYLLNREQITAAFRGLRRG